MSHPTIKVEAKPGNLWSNKAIIEFLEWYEQEPVIWNPNHPDHTDRNESSEAWTRIRDQFSFQSTVSDLKRKKDSLMATYRNLLRKVKQSIKDGEPKVYQPTWFAYANLDRFLGQLYLPMPNHNMVDVALLEPEVTTGSLTQFYQDQEDTILKQEDNLSNQCDEIGPSENLSDNENSLESSTSQQENSCKKSVKKIKLDCSDSRDECDIYGELLAKKLRKFDEKTRDLVMHDIDNIIFRAKRGITYYS